MIINSSNDPTRSTMQEILGQLRTRQRWVNAVRLAAHGMFWSAVAALIAAVIVWMSGAAAPQRMFWPTLGVVVVLTALAALLGLFVPMDDLRLARALDRAASGEDRFASALQLAGHHRQRRAELIAHDALARVRGMEPAAALPLHMPRLGKWVPLPIAALVALLWLAPHSQLEAAPPLAPEISPDEWQALHDEFRRDLDQLPKPVTPEERQVHRQLEELAALLKQKPEKKDALKEMARLSDQIERQRRGLGPRDLSMKNAARALAQSQALKQVASLLKQGEYDKAASELQNLSQQLKDNALSPDAEQFESIASDMERLSAELASHQELQQACQNCANAASSMNRQSLSEAMKRLAEQLKQNSDKLRQCDKCNQCSSLLDRLKRRMNQCSQCSGCKKGCSSCAGNGLCGGPGAGKGGLKAGWGSAANWQGGSLAKADELRLPDVADAPERSGASTSYKVVSPDERANSALSYEELYAEFVQKTEADLDLEMVPVAYREYLRRYFNAIRPQEQPAPPDDQSTPD